jgi:hypothetical protein
MIFDIDNYGGLVIKINIAKIKGDKVNLARHLNAIHDMATDDAHRAGYTVAHMLQIIRDNYPSMVTLI